MSEPQHTSGVSHTPRIIAAWVIVAIPLIYGFSQTLKNAIHLFTG
jgi:hypothetical protein